METTREDWLMAAVTELSTLFEEHGVTLPRVRVSVGFPAGVRGGKNTRAIGQCWAASNVADSIPAIFISPVLDDSVRVLDVLTHELCHAVTPGDGHRGRFARIARAVGLTGPLTATVAGPELTARLVKIANYLGNYRDIHGRIDPHDRKKQGTRMLKASCPNCDFVARVTDKHRANVAHWCTAESGYIACYVA